MPEYKYKAMNPLTGKTVSGKLQAIDEAAFFREIEKKGLVPIESSAKSDEEVSISYKFKTKKLQIFCREFAIFMEAGVTVIDALTKLCNRAKKKKEKEVFMFLVESVEKGNPLAESMQKLGKTFPSMLVEMVRIGETSGTLETVMEKMAVYYEKETVNKSRIQSALIYPVMLVVVTLVVIIFIFTFVMPKFFTILSGDDLPWITKFFMWLSNFLIKDWLYLLLGVLAVIIVYNVIVATKGGRMFVDKVLCSIPLFSKLIEKSTIARFSNTMGILTSAGIVILDSLEICAATLGNTFQRSKLIFAREEVQKGIPFSNALEQQKLFDDLVWSMIATGEETGNVEEMYEKLSRYYDQEAEVATTKLMSIIQPVLLIVIGVIVALVVASILLPIYSSYGSMG